MKTLLALTLVLFAARSSQSQSCDTLVTEGRGFLVTSNLIAAKARFAQAVVACPDHAAARALLAATRLAAFVHEPAGSNFLNRLGIPGAGRSLYEWTAKMPVDATGLPLTPPEVATGDDVTAFVRTSVLPVLQASEQDLAAVADPGFLLHLAAAETKLAEVTVDYGDVLLLRSLLSFAEFLSYSVHSWDLRAQWGVLRSLHTARTLSAERVLAEYPELFRFSTTTDQEAAKQAFARGADLYMQASGLIRTRPPDQIRLFNTDSDSLEPERDFRELLIDLKDSLERPVVLRQSPGLRVYLARFFDASNSPRSWLPDFRENGVLLGTLPQPLTGGLIQQATRTEAELFLGRFLPLSPNLARSPDYGNAGFHGDFFGLPGQSYTFEASSDLNSWMQIGQGLMQEEAASFTDAAALTLSRRFYRARETGRPLNDDFNQRVPLHGLPVVALGSSVNASRELGEPNHNQFGPPVPQTVWWSWTAPSSTPVLISVEHLLLFGAVSRHIGATTRCRLSPVSISSSRWPLHN